VASAFGLVCSSSSSSSSLSEFAMDLANHDIVVVDPYGLCSQLPVLAFFTGIRILNGKKMCGGEQQRKRVEEKKLNGKILKDKDM
jgi:hypothetical protein